MSYVTYAEVFRPDSRVSARFYDVAVVALGSGIIALLSQIAIPLPFTPVPITGQTLGVLLVAMLLGSLRGALSIMAYLAEGAMGLPVFAGGGAGIAHLTGPTGGYLLGFVLAAFVVGRFAELGWDRHFFSTVLAMIIGDAIIFASGMVYLSTFVGWERVLVTGLLPFIPGAIIKIILAAILLPSGWKILHHFFPNA